LQNFENKMIAREYIFFNILYLLQIIYNVKNKK